MRYAGVEAAKRREAALGIPAFNPEPWHIPRVLWNSAFVAYAPLRVYMRMCDAFLFKCWWLSWPLDEWVRKVLAE